MRTSRLPEGGRGHFALRLDGRDCRRSPGPGCADCVQDQKAPGVFWRKTVKEGVNMGETWYDLMGFQCIFARSLGLNWENPRKSKTHPTDKIEHQAKSRGPNLVYERILMNLAVAHCDAALLLASTSWFGICVLSLPAWSELYSSSFLKQQNHATPFDPFHTPKALLFYCIP